MQTSIWAVSEDLTHDAFLGGRIHLWQPRKGYRAGVDPVLLAASVPARAGDTVLELGCGAGAASLCLHARVPGLALTGIEVQPSYAKLAQRNAAAAGADCDIQCCDLRQLPDALRQRQWHHVMMNPPYFDRNSSTASPDAGRDTAMGGDTHLADWLDVGMRRLRPKGTLTIIQRIDRLPEVITAVQGRLGSLVVRPIVGRAGQAANLFLLQGVLSGRKPFHLSQALIMHVGDSHEGDHDSYRASVAAILRDGADLSLRN